MTRLPPENLEWDDAGFLAYEAELVLELYLQGRSYQEAADLTGYSAWTVRELARTVGRMRDPEVDAALERWRSAARVELAAMTRDDLVYRWVDEETEPEDLAAVYQMPVDLVWDAIAAQIASIGSRSVLTRRRLKPACVTTCAFACAGQCAYTVTTSGTGNPFDDVEPRPRADSPARGTISRGRLCPEVIIHPNGTASWRGTDRPT